jgi:uncharacterized protein YjiS (DUF1127 family)
MSHVSRKSRLENTLSLARVWQVIARFWQAHARRRRDRRILAAMNDHELADIGLSRLDRGERFGRF